MDSSEKQDTLGAKHRTKTKKKHNLWNTRNGKRKSRYYYKDRLKPPMSQSRHMHSLLSLALLVRLDKDRNMFPSYHI